MPPILSLHQISKTFGAQTLFEDLSLIITEREKIGLIGHNGSGKSTLLKILAGLEHCDEGEVKHHHPLHVAYLPQNPQFSASDTPQTLVQEALRPQMLRLEAYDALGTRIAQTSDPACLEALLHEQETLQAAIERHGGWEIQHSIVGMLQRLELPPNLLDTPILTLSGGQQRRVALARALLQQPDLLLLDEPTNHLDTTTIEWLEDLLRDYRAAVILVTHDRAFLDAIATRIIEIHRNELLSFDGNYVSFVEQKTALNALRQKEQAKYANLLVTELEWLRRGPKARGTKAKARIERVAEIQAKAKVTHENTLDLQFSTSQRLGNIILHAEGIAKSFDRPIFKPFDFTLQKEDCCAIIGPNGCGKTTLLNVLTRQTEPDQGQIVVGKNTRHAFLSQHRKELDPNMTIYDTLGDGDFVYVDQNPVHKISFLKRFLFDIQEQDKRVETLSGGEKCRLLFAQMVCSNANLLILDEPTNDLDIDSLQALESALSNYNGAILFVTHDRYLINKIATAVLAFDPASQTFIRYEGDYDFYTLCRKNVPAAAAPPKTPPPTKSVPCTASKPRKLTFKENLELQNIETTILNAEEEKAAIETQIADPEIYKHPTLPRELTEKLGAANAKIDALYARWDFLSQVEQGKIPADS